MTIPGALSMDEIFALGARARCHPGGEALEVGHYYGLSTSVLLENLPAATKLTTVDHHEGDSWSGATPFDAFLENVEPYAGRVRMEAICQPFEEVIPALEPDSVGFVFYDADHTEEATTQFWDLVAPKLRERCLVLFDDADWEGSRPLYDLPLTCGFRDVTDRPLYRSSPTKVAGTYTLAVLQRGV